MYKAINNLKEQKGFTLIELLIVVAIIGILAAISIPAYVGMQKKAARSEAYASVEALSLLEEQFFAENACFVPLVAGVCPGSTLLAGTANIQAVLPGFQPEPNAVFTYAITTEMVLTTIPVPIPFAGGAGAQPDCFVAVATGIAGTRVAGDIFAKDCRNNKNF